MAYIVKAYDLTKINLAPATREEEILQNVAVIISTPKFSVPLDRGLGMAQRFLDKPIQTAQPILISEVFLNDNVRHPKDKQTRGVCRV